MAAAIALYAWLPRGLPPPGASLMQEARSLGRAQALLAMLIGVVASADLSFLSGSPLAGSERPST